MKRTILLLIPITLLLSWCTEITNEEIIKQKDICLSWWLDYYIETSFPSLKPINVRCVRPRNFIPTKPTDNRETWFTY